MHRTMVEVAAVVTERLPTIVADVSFYGNGSTLAVAAQFIRDKHDKLFGYLFKMKGIRVREEDK